MTATESFRNSRRSCRSGCSPTLAGRTAGLAIVDEVNGFCTVGAGNLAPPAPDAQVARMVEETDRLARRFAEEKRAILAFLDTHEPGKPEPPYPPHCERGTGEENLVPELGWLEDCGCATLCARTASTASSAASRRASSAAATASITTRWSTGSTATAWTAVIAVGICTDICVMDFVLTLLSARNHGLMPTLADIVVYEPATATYDLPLAATAEARIAADRGAPQGRDPPHGPLLHGRARRAARVGALPSGWAGRRPARADRGRAGPSPPARRGPVWPGMDEIGARLGRQRCPLPWSGTRRTR